jgi:hypothetical protein
MTLIYFSYSAISYKVVLACISYIFMCCSPALELEACVLDECDLSIQLIGGLNMSSMFVHQLEA